MALVEKTLKTTSLLAWLARTKMNIIKFSLYQSIFDFNIFYHNLLPGLLNFLELSQPLLVFRSEYKIVKQKSFNGEVIYASVLQKMITKERANQNASLERLLPCCFAL